MKLHRAGTRTIDKHAWLLVALTCFYMALIVPAVAEESYNPTAFAAAVAAPDIQQGYVMREETWNGKMPSGETKAIAHQLFKGNEYRFYLGAGSKNTKLSVHVYDQDGNLVESNSWQRENADGSFAGAVVRPSSTGTYFLMLKAEASSGEDTPWNMAYAYK
jgi:hypothetical protein